MQGQKAIADGKADLACNIWQACLPLVSERVENYPLLASAFRSIGKLTESENLLDEILKRFPDHPQLLSDKANLMFDRGHVDQAAQTYLELAADAKLRNDTLSTLNFLSNALMTFEYSETIDPFAKRKIAEEWGALAKQWALKLVKTENIPSHSTESECGRALRVGFISGDLCDHPVGFILLPLLQQYNPAIWSPYIFDNGSRCDGTHKQLHSCVDANNWHQIGGTTDADTMRLILAKQLDCLIDLSGHTGKSRLRLMAHRLAKLQLSWIGFTGTTGLTTVDGIILDNQLSQGAENQYCEKILHITPSRFCFRPPFTPPIKSLPSKKNGFITFGSFNNTAKHNKLTIEMWAGVLKKVPNCRLLLKWRTFADKDYSDTVLRAFNQHGVDQSRITLRGFSTHRQMLEEYNEVDIALDTYPFSGGYTTLEALWMGLPVITLTGNAPISRQSASFLKSLQRAEWIATSSEHYIQIACDLAFKPNHLNSIRERQRFDIMENAIYDETNLARKFEALIKGLCATTEAQIPEKN